MSDRRTKAQLLTDLNRAQARVDELDAQKSVVIERPVEVPEASALAQCIRALDRLSSGRDRWQTQGDVERVLRSLAGKYGIEVFKTDVRTEPCDRPHLDALGPADLGGYLLNVARGDTPNREARR